MVIAAERRGAGLGRRLLRAAVGRAYEHHAARRVWLDVKDDNVRARALLFRPCAVHHINGGLSG